MQIEDLHKIIVKNQIKKRENTAATIIQAIFRGYIIRKQYQKVQRQRKQAALTIQKFWKVYQARTLNPR